MGEGGSLLLAEFEASVVACPGGEIAERGYEGEGLFSVLPQLAIGDRRGFQIQIRTGCDFRSFVFADEGRQNSHPCASRGGDPPSRPAPYRH